MTSNYIKKVEKIVLGIGIVVKIFAVKSTNICGNIPLKIYTDPLISGYSESNVDNFFPMYEYTYVQIGTDVFESNWRMSANKRRLLYFH